MNGEQVHPMLSSVFENARRMLKCGLNLETKLLVFARPQQSHRTKPLLSSFLLFNSNALGDKSSWILPVSVFQQLIDKCNMQFWCEWVWVLYCSVHHYCLLYLAHTSNICCQLQRFLCLGTNLFYSHDCNFISFIL